MKEPIDAVVAAGGRLRDHEALRFGSDVKALVRIGGLTLIERIVAALRAAPEIGNVVVVGPESVRRAAPDIDRWIPEASTGEENVLLALRAGRTARVLFCASDMPFVRADAIADFLSRVPAAARAAYPVFARDDFLAAYPGGRTRFVRLSDGEWTGGSVFALDPAWLVEREALLRRAFSARKNPASLAGLFGPWVAARFALGRVGITDIEARATALLGSTVCVIRGADPCLAMDCDEVADFEFALARTSAPRPAS